MVRSGEIGNTGPRGLVETTLRKMDAFSVELVAIGSVPIYTGSNQNLIQRLGCL